MSELIGCYIHGTLREEDLIPAFVELATARLVEIESSWSVIDEGEEGQQRLDVSQKTQIEHSEHRFHLSRIEVAMKDPMYFGSEQAEHDVNELLPNLLNTIAPEGYRFGNQEHDPSDFGYWKGSLQ